MKESETVQEDQSQPTVYVYRLGSNGNNRVTGAACHLNTVTPLY